MGADGKMKSKKEMEGLNKVKLVNLRNMDTWIRAENISGFERDPGQEGGRNGTKDYRESEGRMQGSGRRRRQTGIHEALC